MNGHGITALSVKVECIGPGDDHARIAEASKVGQGGVEQLPSQPAISHGPADAGRTECAQAAIVGLMRAEPGDLSIDLGVEEGGGVVIEGARGLESPDAPELTLDEIEDALPVPQRAPKCGAAALGGAGR